MIFLFHLTSEGYEIQSYIDGSILTVADVSSVLLLVKVLLPDLLSIVLAVATRPGSVLIHQKMFESRLFFVDKPH